MDDSFYLNILEENRDAVKAKVTEAMFAAIQRKFEWELPDAVNKAVNEFVAEQIVPEIKAHLLSSKDEIVEAATVMVRSIPVEIGKAMQAQLAQRLTQSWTLSKVCEALFR